MSSNMTRGYILNLQRSFLAQTQNQNIISLTNMPELTQKLHNTEYSRVRRAKNIMRILITDWKRSILFSSLICNYKLGELFKFSGTDTIEFSNITF